MTYITVKGLYSIIVSTDLKPVKYIQHITNKAWECIEMFRTYIST